MVLTDTGINKHASNFASEITKGQWGTSTTDPNPSQTGLIAPLSDTLNTLDSGVSSGKSATFQHTTTSTQATAKTLTEFELEYSDSTNLLRIVSGEINKTNAFDLITIATVNFNRGNQ